MARKFFITGGTGLIGRALVRKLLSERSRLGIEQITLLTRNPERFLIAAPDIAGSDLVQLRSGDVVELKAESSERYSDFIHGAADVNDMSVQRRLEYSWNIAEATKRTVDFAEQTGCQRYLYLSSGGVYGPGPYPDEGIPETWAIAPNISDVGTAYGQSKRYSEHLCALLAERTQIAVRVARIFSVIGPESPLTGQFALGNFVRDALNPDVDQIRIKGNGTASRSYLHVSDLSEWLLAIHERSDRIEVFNVGSDHEITIRQLAELVSNCLPNPKPVLVENAIADFAGRARYFPDCHKLKADLGQKTTISIEVALRELVDISRSVLLN